MTQPDVRDEITGYDKRGRCVDELRRYMNMSRHGKYAFGVVYLQLGASYNMVAPARKIGLAELVKNSVADMELESALKFDEKARLQDHEFIFVYCMADDAKCVQAKDAIAARLKSGGLCDFSIVARTVQPFDDVSSESLLTSLEELANES